MMRVLLVAEGPSELNGALQCLVCRLRGENIEFRCERMSDPKVRVHITRGKGAGFTKRALAWLRFAVREQLDAVVLLIDQDGDTERQQQIDQAQASQLFSLPRAMGLAVQMFEAWMLADEQALTHVLGCMVHRQKSPESIRNPKDVFNGLASSARDNPTELYARIAQVSDLDRIRADCPTGFAIFAERVEAM